VYAKGRCGGGNAAKDLTVGEGKEGNLILVTDFNN